VRGVTMEEALSESMEEALETARSSTLANVLALDALEKMFRVESANFIAARELLKEERRDVLVRQAAGLRRPLQRARVGASRSSRYCATLVKNGVNSRNQHGNVSENT
jgi:hypothetical protein